MCGIIEIGNTYIPYFNDVTNARRVLRILATRVGGGKEEKNKDCPPLQGAISPAEPGR